MSRLQVKSGDLIAVYGLLRAGQIGYHKFRLDQKFELVGSCQLFGKMYDMGGFPGLFAGSSQVQADLFRVLNPSVMKALDGFEDFWPNASKPSRYQRKMTKLSTPSRTLAWVYHCQLSNADCTLVMAGDWLKWCAEHYADMVRTGHRSTK